MNELRRSRLESLIAHLLGRLISVQEIKDYRVGVDISITAVRVSSDGGYADVHLSSFESAERSAKGAAGLNSAAGFIRRKLAPELHLRKIPVFRFYADHSLRTSQAAQEHLENLLAGQSKAPPHGEMQPKGGETAE